MVIYLDTNIIVDYFIKREFSEEAEKIFKFCAKECNSGVIASLSLSTIFYLFRKSFSVEERKKQLQSLMRIFSVAAVDRNTVAKALSMDINDYEDAIQMVCAKDNKADCIVTNNIKDFKNFDIEVITSKDFVMKYISDK